MQEKKKTILEAALASVAEKGLQRSTTAEIANRAGVGEGTLYRYFSSKDELFEQAAFYAGDMISDALLGDYEEGGAVDRQYVALCVSFLKNGKRNPMPHKFMEQFRNSPQGIEFKKKRISEISEKSGDRLFFYPLSTVIKRAMIERVVKQYPFQILASLTLGPLIFVVKDCIEGLIELDEDLMESLAEACWDSIRRQDD